MVNTDGPVEVARVGLTDREEQEGGSVCWGERCGVMVGAL